MAMNPRNPNRDLPADEVRARLREKLPHRAEGLSSDRAWIWLVTNGKPSEEDRTILKDLGFRFTPAVHILPDGNVSHWYHAAGGAVLRRRRRKTGTTESEEDSNQPAQPEPAIAAFLAWAQPQ